jgi:hypothetical protein
MVTILISLVLAFLLMAASVPPGWTDVISIAVGLVITFALKFSPIPSRVVGAVGALAALYGTFGDKLVGLFPEGSRVPIYIAVFGAVILAISERLQGGITVPEKRKEAAKAEQKGETF